MVHSINHELEAYFKTAPETFHFETRAGELEAHAQFFRFGQEATLFGRVCGSTAHQEGLRPDLLSARLASSNTRELPFDALEAVDQLRNERYPLEGEKKGLRQELVRLLYYTLRPLLPVDVRKYAQRRALKGWEDLTFPGWPVERSVDALQEKLLWLELRRSGKESIPFIWFWPEGMEGCILMTHDVETDLGLQACTQLMDLNESFGIHSSFQLIPGARYKVDPETIARMRSRGFEVNIHDWNHDGSLFKERHIFEGRAAKINRTAEKWKTVGFRSAALYRNIDWLRELHFEYDMSIPSCARLDPQRGGCCTLMPWFNGHLLEIPVTTIQDYSLFNILNQYSIDIWKRQTNAILNHHGMATFIVHPDYIQAARARATYAELLQFLAGLEKHAGAWIALPQQVNDWWRQRAAMQLENDGDSWRVTGTGSERAHVAFAQLDGDDIVYTLGTPAGSNHRVFTPPLEASRSAHHA